jgi:hypothetical protein
VPPRLYTLDEAEALLPSLIPILEAIRAAHQELTEAVGDSTRLEEPIASNGHVKAEPLAEARQAQDRARAVLRERAAELNELGVELKDLSTGLIDFRARREGRIVYLCWRLGEPRIDWWHELDTGFAGRRRLERPD